MMKLMKWKHSFKNNWKLTAFTFHSLFSPWSCQAASTTRVHTCTYNIIIFYFLHRNTMINPFFLFLHPRNLQFPPGFPFTYFPLYFYIFDFQRDSFSYNPILFFCLLLVHLCIIVKCNHATQNIFSLTSRIFLFFHTCDILLWWEWRQTLIK